MKMKNIKIKIKLIQGNKITIIKTTIIIFKNFI